MQHRLVLATGLMLAGCASQFSYDLGKADQPCHDRSFPSREETVACLASQERPVWETHEPQTLDLYDQYAARRDELARQFDRGLLTEDQYRDDLSALSAEFRGRIEERRKALAAAPPQPRN